jgi:hypothetical protein
MWSIVVAFVVEDHCWREIGDMFDVDCQDRQGLGDRRGEGS